ncbi:Zn-dependent peptidase [Dirofilaria immitis]|nr:Zn-dependent peptidase [Dirofilaria immitis]
MALIIPMILVTKRASTELPELWGWFYSSIRLALGIPLNEIDISYNKINDVDLGNVNSKIRTIFSTDKLIGRLLPKAGNNENNRSVQRVMVVSSLYHSDCGGGSTK